MEIVIDMELCMGFRHGELFGLQWCDADWEKNRIHICRNRMVERSARATSKPKNSKEVLDELVYIIRLQVPPRPSAKSRFR